MTIKKAQNSRKDLIRRFAASGKFEYLLRGVGIFLKDYSTGVSFPNTFWRDCGYDEEDMSRSRWIELLHPEDRERMTEAIERLLSGEADFFAGEYRLRDSKGTYRWIRHKALVLERTPGGIPSLYMGVDIDITDLMRKLEDEKSDFEEMERRYLEAEALRLAGAFVTAGDPRESLDRVLAQSVGVVPADAVFLWAPTEKGLECVGARGSEKLPDVSARRMPRSFSWVLEEKRPRRNSGRTISRGKVLYKDSLYMPVVAHGRVMAILEFLGKESRGLGHRAEGPAAVFADSVAVALENALEFRELDREAGVDWLTGLPTRRRFDFRARAYLEGPKDQSRFCVIMIDLDKFKAVNDTFGHSAGDTALVAAARVCREALRSTDLVCRYGGEEIAILLPGANGRAGRSVAERIRSGVEALEFPEYPGMRITVSMGVRVGGVGDRDLTKLLGQADKAMYKAKEGGRNQVVLSEKDDLSDSR